MEKPAQTHELSPLDQIRLVEGEMARRLIVAREAAEQAAGKARAEAEQIKREAKEKGDQEGRIRYREATARAEEEAQAIRAEAQARAETLQRDGARHMDRAVDRALRIVLGEEVNGADHEP